MVSLSTLPVEILHRIFSELDITTLFLSVRKVCQQLRAVVDTHHRYTLDFTSICKPDSHRLLGAIRPEHVTGLSLSNAALTPGQIDLFVRWIDIGLFTRLRSLKLLNTDGGHLCTFLKHASGCSLTSLIIHSELVDFKEWDELLQHISSIISQPSLLHLELINERLSQMIEVYQWPVHCNLRYLRIEGDIRFLVSRMMDHLPDLETLIIDNVGHSFADFRGRPVVWFSAPRPRLTFLSLSRLQQRMDELRSLLSQTPFLRHLKIVTTSPDTIDGSQWEELIKSKLPFLNKFEFYIRFYPDRSMGQTEESMLNALIVPFRTPFWTEEKRWLVTCNSFPAYKKADLYTSPICIPAYTHVPDPKTMTISNFDRENPQSTALETVNGLCVDLWEVLFDERVSHFHYSSTLVSE